MITINRFTFIIIVIIVIVIIIIIIKGPMSTSFVSLYDGGQQIS